METVMRWVAVAAVVVASVACESTPKTSPASETGPRESFVRDMTRVCNVVDEMGGALEAHPTSTQKQLAVASHLARTVRDHEVRALLTSLPGMSTPKRQEALDEAAGRAGLEGCAYLAPLEGAP